MSSTYKDRIIRPTSIHLTKKNRIITTRNKSKRRDHNNNKISNQVQDTCLRLYNTFLSLQTYPNSCETLEEGII